MSLASGINSTSKALSVYLEDNNISKEVSIQDLIIYSGMFSNKRTAAIIACFWIRN